MLLSFRGFPNAHLSLAGFHTCDKLLLPTFPLLEMDYLGLHRITFTHLWVCPPCHKLGVNLSWRTWTSEGSPPLRGIWSNNWDSSSFRRTKKQRNFSGRASLTLCLLLLSPTTAAVQGRTGGAVHTQAHRHTVHTQALTHLLSSKLATELLSRKYTSKVLPNHFSTKKRHWYPIGIAYVSLPPPNI